MAPEIDPIRPTDADAIAQAKHLVRTARFGALAVLDSKTGIPTVSRVATATDIDGSPVILVSELSPHTGSMKADPRVSLLLGEPGKGDPLAHPRITLFCTSSQIRRDGPDYQRINRRYLNRQPKAALYSGFADFSYFKLTMTGASLNGGFGKAYRLQAEDLITDSPANADLAEVEQSVIDHMNVHHRGTVRPFVAPMAKLPQVDWTITGIDAEGIDLACGDHITRVLFSNKLNDAGKLRQAVVLLARKTRQSIKEG